jgi:hypothetical protein
MYSGRPSAVHVAFGHKSWVYFDAKICPPRPKNNAGLFVTWWLLQLRFPRCWSATPESNTNAPLLRNYAGRTPSCVTGIGVDPIRGPGISKFLGLALCRSPLFPTCADRRAGGCGGPTDRMRHALSAMHATAVGQTDRLFRPVHPFSTLQSGKSSS